MSMQYLLTPFPAHFDSGFGATATSFYNAAAFLDRSPEVTRGNLFGERLPVNFLYRHAIELFLKSAIAIFHRRLQLPYGEAAFDGHPMVSQSGKWVPFNRVHSVSTLWEYVKFLFAEHAEWLRSNTPDVWSYDAAVADEAVSRIEASDPVSTFFRYPTLKDLELDSTKGAMKPVSEADLAELLRASEGNGENVFAFVIQNDRDEFVRAYVADKHADDSLADALREFAGWLHNLHAAMRVEITHGE